jgi:hypothetical protein
MPIQLLLVEDDPGDARPLRETLRESPSLAAELVHVERLAQARERLRRAVCARRRGARGGYGSGKLPRAFSMRRFSKRRSAVKLVPVSTVSASRKVVVVGLQTRFSRGA